MNKENIISKQRNLYQCLSDDSYQVQPNINQLCHTLHSKFKNNYLAVVQTFFFHEGLEQKKVCYILMINSLLIDLLYFLSSITYIN